MLQQNTFPVMGFDTETFLICAQAPLPRIICSAVACENGNAIETDHDMQELHRCMHALVTSPFIKVGHNLAYDLGVTVATFPDLMPMVWYQLEHGLMCDTIIREKLLRLADCGDIDYDELPNGETKKVNYGLADLVRSYLGIDISESKKKQIKNDPQQDGWRTNYHLLSGKPLEEWPQEAVDYALSDAVYALKIWHLQEARRHEIYNKKGYDPFATESFRVGLSFSLQLMQAEGMRVDATEKAKIEELLKNELTPDKLNLLYDTGILRPAEPPRPHARGAKDANGQPKMTAGKEESVNQKVLQAYIERLCTERPDEFELRRTDPSDKFPDGQIQCNKDWLADFAALDPVLTQYAHRQNLIKLLTDYLPAMEASPGVAAEFVYPGFNALVSTGRTSSFADKLLPSWNAQNVDPRVRRCIIPRDGYLLFSADYSGMELGTTAQMCLNLFGFSKLAEIINKDIDPHEYLGAYIAVAADPQFAQYAATFRDPYEAFHTLKAGGADSKKFWKHYRTFAKPTGLGYPGGLGAETFVRYAKSTFEVQVDISTARQLRELWKSTFPEMVHYLDWVNNQIDPHNPPKKIKTKSGEEKYIHRHHYVSPFGMYRAGCDYCACANGYALQTPSAEGASLAVWEAVRACKDPARGHPLLLPDAHGPQVRILAFIHDELFGEVRNDGKAHDRLMVICDIMARCMRQITPDVVAKANPALMERWDKAAETVYDENNRLTVWKP